MLKYSLENTIFINILDNNKDKNYIIVGGTGLYIKAGLYDYKFTEYCITVDKKDSDKTKFKMNLMRSKAVPVKLSHISRTSFIEIKTEN